MISPWRVFLFGGLRLERDGQTVTRFRSQKTAGLLALLCLHPGRDWGREELCEIFWPDAQHPETARNSLRVALASLRKILEPPPCPTGSVLEATPTHVRLRPDTVRTDVAAFEAAVKAGNRARAQDLYVGPLLPGVYDEWAIREADRLAEIWDALNIGPTPAPKKISVDGPTAKATGVEHAAAVLPPLLENLPLPLDRFFGRDEEAVQLEMWLTDPTTRLITLVGAGGTGKTRFAVETARQLLREKSRAGRFSAGVWFLPLAPVRDAGRIPGVLRDALGLAPSPGADALEQVIAHLEGRPALVLLDNLEQIGGADLAAFLSHLVECLPRVVWLATSRRRTGLRGERILRLPPLVPPTASDTLEDIARNPAARLFTDRAREADVDFALSARNAADVAHVCTLLDGVPLALELAAAWANVFTPKQMVEGLQARAGQFAVRRLEDREERHQSLYQAVRWSYDLLPRATRQLFARLSVFAGGFTLDAASAVCDLPDTPDALARLVEQSLVLPSPSADSNGDRRLTLLEPLREFGAEQLTETERVDFTCRHAEWIIARVEAATGAGQWTDLEADSNNIRAALRRLLAAPGVDAVASERAARLCGASWLFWWNRGLWDEGMDAVKQACARDSASSAPSVRIVLWRACGALHYYRNQYDEAEACWQRQLTIALDAGEVLLAARAQVNLAMIASARNEFDSARQQCADAIALYESINADAASRAAAYNNMGTNCFLLDDLPAARDAFQTALDLFRALGEAGKQGSIPALTGIGAVQERLGDYAGAYESFSEATKLSRETGIAMRLADSLLHLASAASQLDHPTARADAARHLAEAIPLRRQLQNNEGIGRALETAIALLQKRGDTANAARVWGAYRALYRAHPSLQETPQQKRTCDDAHTGLCAILGADRFAQLATEGATWDSAAALDFLATVFSAPLDN